MTHNSTPDHMNIHIRRYGSRNWAVYVNDELLCVTVYRKGAVAVQEFILKLLPETLQPLNLEEAA